MGLTFTDEYDALHRHAVWTDRTERDARLTVTGPDAADWLQGLLTQDVKALSEGRGAQAAYLTPQGRMVADLRVLHRGAAGFLLETPASARAALVSRLDQFIIMEDVTLTDVSATVGCLTVIGPEAAEVVAACTGMSASSLHGLVDLAQVPLPHAEAFVVSSSDFGAPALDLVAPTGTIDAWRTALEARVPSASERLLDTARIEAGRPRFGVDMHEDTIPLEAGIEARAISHDKGCYVGQEVVIRILHRGQGRVARRLVWVASAGDGAPREPWPAGTEVARDGKGVGTVTSACWSPARRALLAIAMLHRDATEPGTHVRVGSDDAHVARLP